MKVHTGVIERPEVDRLAAERSRPAAGPLAPRTPHRNISDEVARVLTSLAFPARFGNAEEPGTGRILHALCLLGVVAVMPSLIHSVALHRVVPSCVLGALEVCLSVGTCLNWQGKIEWAARLICFGGLVAGALLVSLSERGIYDQATLLFPAVLVVSAVLLDWRSYRTFATLTIFTAMMLGIAGVCHFLRGKEDVDWQNTIDLVAAQVVIAVAVGLLARNLKESLFRSHQNIAAFQAIVSATTGHGAAFFDALVKELAKVFDVKLAFVAELLPEEPRRARTVAACSRGFRIADFEYELPDAVTASSGADFGCRPPDLRHQFPLDPLLSRPGDVCCLQIPMSSAAGEVLGLLTMVDDRPIQTDRMASSLLNVLAERAAMELERQHAEQALKESEDRYRATIESQGEGVVVVDADQRIVDSNPAADRIMGLARGGLIGRTLKEFVPPQDAPVLEREFASRKSGTNDTYELNVRLANGKQRTLLITAAPQFDGSARFIGSVGVFRDITESRRTEAEVRASERRFRELIENVKLAAIMLDRESNITFCNDYLLAATGWTREEIVGRPVAEFIEPGFHKPHGEPRASALRSGKIDRPSENAMLTKDGARRWIQWNHATLRNPAGHITGFASLGVDVTGHCATAEQCRHAQEIGCEWPAQARSGSAGV